MCPVQTEILHDTCSCKGESDRGDVHCATGGLGDTNSSLCAWTRAQPPNIHNTLIRLVHHHLPWPGIRQDHDETVKIFNTSLNNTATTFLAMLKNTAGLHMSFLGVHAPHPARYSSHVPSDHSMTPSQKRQGASSTQWSECVHTDMCTDHTCLLLDAGPPSHSRRERQRGILSRIHSLSTSSKIHRSVSS